MSVEVTAKFRDEKAAIQQLRRLYPAEKQMTLAKRIRTANFSDPAHLALAIRAGVRSRLSIYSVIRRFDKDSQTNNPFPHPTESVVGGMATA